MIDKIDKRQRLGDNRYYKTWNDRFRLVLTAFVIVLFLFGVWHMYQQFVISQYRTRQQEMEQVKQNILSVQRLDHIPEYTISITKK